MIFYKIYFILILFFLSCLQYTKKIPPPIKEGILDLRNWNFEADGFIPLNGEWEFYYNKLIYPDSDELSEEKKFLNSPSSWEDYGYPLFGFATYRLKIQNIEPRKIYALKIPNMNSSYKLFINKKLIAQNGVVAERKELYVPQHLPIMANFYIHESEIEILLQIANYNDNISGIWDSILFGTSEIITQKYITSLGLDIFYLGIISIMGLYHIFLFFFRKNDYSSLFFALFCLVISLRIILTGEKLLLQILPNLNWEFHIKLEYLTVYLLLPLFGYFILFNFYSEKLINNYQQILKNISIKSIKENYILLLIHFIAFITIPFILITLTTKVIFYGKFINYYQILIFISIVYYYYLFFLGIFDKKEGAIFSLIGLLMPFITTINDVLYAKRIVHTAYLLPFGIFIFILFQSLSLAYKFSMAFFRIEELTKKLSKLLHSFERFVPREFLQILNKQDISQVELGNQIQKEMIVMFIDIQNFTSFSEKLTPEENFKFINYFFNEIEPIIKNHSGFIDKYLGDGLMALFSTNGDNAIICSIEIQKKIKEINKQLSLNNYNLKTRIGIHTGLLILGVVGSSHRIETTVISDVVNTASRLEKLNKEFGSDIIISENLLNKTVNLEKFKYRYLGNIKLKGKEYPVRIYEIYNHYPENIIEIYDSTKEELSDGIKLYSLQKIDLAYEVFKNIIQKNPDDPVAQYLLNQCRIILGL